MSISPRVDQQRCRKGLHDWEESKTWLPSEERFICGECKKIAQAAWRNGESHPQNASFCKRGHSYTLENTRKKVRMVKGKKTIIRQCIQCEKDSTKTSRR